MLIFQKGWCRAMMMTAVMSKESFIKMSKNILNGKKDINYQNPTIGGISLRQFDNWQDFFERDLEYCTVRYHDDGYAMLLEAIDIYATSGTVGNYTHRKLNQRIRFLIKYGFH